MKKILITTLITISAFAMNHGQTKDPDLQLALEGKYTQALKGFENRCDAKNDAYACGMVAYFYNKGFGTEKNIKKAIKYYKKGCNLNDKDSCTLLGYYYYKGEILPQNTAKAKEYLNKACKLGNKDACNYLHRIK